ncbi:uncharacterized protein LOC123225739 isoform X2 [Mangifera indica]|uniref:uncharacterized protein LOC123225739 isoform X2 n=1 Tax=Mangifera indica TaxID=29780 RepID=UPI001CFBFE87|nr:uncharacterized protein LOC123225739 isoform X2 [Mangifera indica]
MLQNQWLFMQRPLVTMYAAQMNRTDFVFFLSIISILRWGELESGQTTIAFTPAHQHETDDLTGSVQTFKSGGVRQPVELCFDYPDVDAAYKKAVENGAVAVSQPENKEWGQKVGYVRDIDGIVIRMGNYVQAQK